MSSTEELAVDHGEDKAFLNLLPLLSVPPGTARVHEKAGGPPGQGGR